MPLQSPSLASLSFVQESRHRAAAARQNEFRGIPLVVSSSFPLAGIPQSGAVDLSMCPSRETAVGGATAKVSSTLTLRYTPSDAPWRETAHLPSDTVAASLAGAVFHAAAAAASAGVPAATASSAAISAAHSPAVAYTPRHSSPASAAGVAGSPLPAACIPSLTGPAPAGALERKDGTAHTTLRWPSSPPSPGHAVMIADPATVYFPAFAAWLSGLPARSACELLLHAAVRSGKSADTSFERCCSPFVAAAAQQQEQPGYLEASLCEEEQRFQISIDQQKQQQHHQPPLVDLQGHNAAAAAAAAAAPQFVCVQQPTAAPGRPTPEESTESLYAQLWNISSRRQPRHHEEEETAHRLLQHAALTSAYSAAQVHPHQRGKPLLLQQDAHLLQHCPLRSDSRRRSNALWRGAKEESRAGRRQLQPASGISAAQVKVSAGLLQQQTQQELDEEGSRGYLQQQRSGAQLQQHQQQERACAPHAFCEQQVVQKSERHASKQLQRQTQRQFLRESQVHAPPQRQCQQQQQTLNDNDQHRRQDQQSEKQGQKPRQEQQQREQQEEKRPRRRRDDTARAGGGRGQRSREVARAEAAHVRDIYCSFRKQQQRAGVSVEQQGRQDVAAPCMRQREVRFTRQTRTLLQQLLLEKIQEQYLLFELLLTEGAFRLEPQQPPPWPLPPPAAAVALAAVLLLRGSEAPAATLTESTPARTHIIPAAGIRGATRGAARAQGSGALAGGVVAEGCDFLQPAVWGVSHLCPCTISNAVAEAPIAAAAAAAEAAAFSAPAFRRSFQWRRMYSAAAASGVIRKAALRATAEDTRTTEAWRHAAARRTWSAVPRGPLSASAEGVSATQAPYSGEVTLTGTSAGEHEGFSVLTEYQKAKAMASEWAASIPRPVGCCVVLPPSVLHVLLRGYFSLDAAILLRLLLLPTSQQHLLVGDTCCCWLGGSAAAAHAPERPGKGAAAGTSAVRPFLAMSRMLAAFTGRRRHKKPTSLGLNLCCDIAAAAACGGVAVVRRQLENIQRVRRYVAAGALQQLLQPRRSYLRKVRSLFSSVVAVNTAPAAAPFSSAALQPAAAADLPSPAAVPSSRAAEAGADFSAEHFSDGCMGVPAFLEQQSAAQPYSCIFCTQLPPCVSVAVAVHLLLPAFLGSRLGFLYWRICFILQHNLLLPPVLQAAGSGATAATCVGSHGQAVSATAPARACNSATVIHRTPHFEGTAMVGGPATARDRAEVSIQQSKGLRKKEGILTGSTETAGHGGPTAATAAKTERRHGKRRRHLGIPHFYLRKSEKGTGSGRRMQVKENSGVPSAEQGRTSDTWRCPALCCFSCIDRLLLRLLQLLYGSSRSVRLHTRQSLPSTRGELKQRPNHQRENRAMLLSGNGKATPRGRGEEEGAEGGVVPGKAAAAGEIPAAEVSVAPRRLTTAAAEEVAGGPVNTRGKPSAAGLPVAAAAAAASTEVSAAVLAEATGDYREGQVSTAARAKGEARETAAAAAAAATLRLPQWCTLGSAAIQAKCNSLGASVATLRATARRSLVAATFSKKRTGSSVASGEKTKIYPQGGVQLLQQHVLFHLGRFREVTEQQRSSGHRSQMLSCFENPVPPFSPPASSGLTAGSCRLSKNTSAAAGLIVPSAAARGNIDSHTHAAAANSCVRNALPVGGSFPASFGGRHLLSAACSSVSRGGSPKSEDAAAAAAAERNTFVSASVCSSAKPLPIANAVTASVAQQAISPTVGLSTKTAGVHATEKEETAADVEVYLRAHATADREGSPRSRSSFDNAVAAEVQSICDTWETDMQKFQIGTSALFRSFYALLCCFSSAESFGSSLLHAWDLAVLLGSPRNTASAIHCCCCSCCCSSVEYSSCSATAFGASVAMQGDKQHVTAAQGGTAAAHGIPPRLSRNGALSLPSIDKKKTTSSSLHKLLSPARAEGLEAALGRTAGGESILVLPATAHGATAHEQKDGATAAHTEDCSGEHRQRQQHVLESVYQQKEEDREQQQERWTQQQQSLEDAGERRRPSGAELRLQGEADNIQQPNVYKHVQVQQREARIHSEQKENEAELPRHGRGKSIQQSDMAGEEQKQQKQQTSFEYWRRRREQLRLYFAACEVALLELFASKGRRRSRQMKLGAVARVSTNKRHLATGTGSLTQPEVCCDFSWSQSSSSNSSSASESGYTSRCPRKRSRTQNSSGRRGTNSRRKDCNSCRKHGNQRNSSDTVGDRAEGRRGRCSIRKEVHKGGAKFLLGIEGRSIRKPSFCAAASTPAAYAKARKLIRHCHSFALSLIDHPLQHCSRCGGSFAECKVDG